MKFAWKNVLFSTHTKPAYMPPPRYGENMVVCGPLYPNRKSADGTVISLNTPVGQRYDIASVIAALPDEQKPDIVIARIDAGMGNVPVNIAAAGVPTLALLGDSHHMRAPLTNLLRYTLNERFDFHILDHNKQHAHWYLEAGLRNVVWIPALLLDANFKPPVADTKKEIVFIGQRSPAHPRRSRLISHIQSCGLPLSLDMVPHRLAAVRYNDSRITMNCSLNGDFNLRVFETMAAGGMLLTDRLSSASGLYELFNEGEEFSHYGNHDEFVKKAEYFLKNPAERNRIATNAYQAVTRLASIHARIKMLDDLVKTNQIDPRLTVSNDRRSSAYGCHSKTDLYYRVRLYEWMQEQHRHYDNIRVVNMLGADGRILCDLADLPHLRLHCASSQLNRDLVINSGLEKQVNYFSGPLPPLKATEKNVVIVASTELDQCLEDHRPDALLISDLLSLDGDARNCLAERLSHAGYFLESKLGGIACLEGQWQRGTRAASA